MDTEAIEGIIKAAKEERDRKVMDAEREYQDAVSHVEWVLNRLRNLNPPQDKPELLQSDSATPLSETIRRTASYFDSFTVDEMFEALEPAMPNIRERESTVVTILSRMRSDGLLENKVIGARGRPHVYAPTKRLLDKYMTSASKIM